MEPIQDVKRLSEFVGNNVQVWPPHVTTHVLYAQANRLAETIQAAPQARFTPILSHGQQPFLLTADVVHQRQVRVPPRPSDLIYAKSCHVGQIPMRQTPLNRVLNGPAHAVPGRTEYRANLAPAQPLGPGRQVPAVGG